MLGNGSRTARSGSSRASTSPDARQVTGCRGSPSRSAEIARARVDGRGRALLYLTGGGSLRYSRPSATDSHGRALNAWLTASSGRLSILVNDSGAQYPLRVDPFIQQGSKLVGTGIVGTFADQGFSVALSADGNTALVGGWYDNSNVGAAWVFVRSGGAWTQQAS